MNETLGMRFPLLRSLVITSLWALGALSCSAREGSALFDEGTRDADAQPTEDAGQDAGGSQEGGPGEDGGERQDGGDGGGVDEDASTPPDASGDDAGPTCAVCSSDGTQILDCEDGKVLATCAVGELCTATGCKDACEAAVENQSSIGCEYYAVMLDGGSGSTGARNRCFVSFVANTSSRAAHLEATLGATPVDLAAHARIPKGTGSSLTYEAYDPNAGLAAGEVAILFLGGGQDGLACPVPSAFPEGASAGMQVNGTGRGRGVRIRSDVPVVAYQMFPYGGGSAALTGASLLLPTSVWNTNYVAVNAYERSKVTDANPSMTLVAKEDGTEITILPKVAIEGAANVESSEAGVAVTYSLSVGETLQIAQGEELTGSPIQANKPIGLFAAHACMNVPSDTQYCDHAEQQIPPVRALGHEYVGVTHKQRSNVAENPPWRLIGAVDGTKLTFDPDVGGPATLNRGEVHEFRTATPFVVRSQDTEHPFLLVTYMTSSRAVSEGYGDSDFVRISASAQYLNRYVFFTDPTYPETNLVVVRKRGANGFEDVTLGCAGLLTGWTPVDSPGLYEYTRIDLVSGNFVPQNGCNNGRHEMSSKGSFGLWVWGWGTPKTNPNTQNVSYGYPAGESVQAINKVTVPVVPK